MNLLWNLVVALFTFLLSAVALAVVLAYLKQFFCDYPWRKRAKFCYKQTKRWWKKGRDTWLKDVAIPKIKTVASFLFGLLMQACTFIGRHWKPITTSIVIFWTINWFIVPKDVFETSLMFAGTILVIVLSAVVALGVIIKFRKHISRIFSRATSIDPLSLAVGGIFVTIIFSVLATIVTLILFGLQSCQQSKLLSNQSQQLDQQADNAKKQIAAEQFKNAIDLLGSKEQVVVLGGVHALHNLAMTFPKEYSQPVFEILCSFIREKTAKPEYQAQVLATFKSSDETKTPTPTATTPTISLPFFRQSDKPETPNQATSLIVIQTIVDKLFRDKIELEEIGEKTGGKFILYRKYEANLSGAFLQGIDFTNASLQKAVLQNVDLQDANLLRADLQNANLQGADLQNANLQGAWLPNANLQGAKLIETNLQGAKLDNANLQRAWFSNANLQGANLYKANLQGANLYKADLQMANLFKAGLQEANLTRAKLQGADLREANLQGANLYKANLQGANLYKADLQMANLFKAGLQEANLTRANLQGANLQMAKLDNANLQRAVLREANLHGAELNGADLQDTKLQGADLTNAYLQGADLRDANLQGADLREANLQGANLQMAKLDNANLQRAWFSNANLQGAWLYSANLQWTNLDDANLRGVQCNSMYYHETIKDAITNKTGLKTDLSEITLYDDNGNVLGLDEDGKKAWLSERGANVDDLTAEEVQELFKDFKWE